METIKIAMICDDNYVLPTVVAMTSIVKNMGNEHITFFVVCDSLSEENIDIVKRFECEEIEVCIIVTDSTLFAGLEKAYSSVSKAAMLKFRLPELISENKVLYIDGDVIVRKNLRSLYEMNIENVYAAVIKDGPKPENIPGGKKHYYYANPNYFNSGVMLLNLEKMRNDRVSQKLIDFRMKEYNYFMDQDAFNMIFGEKVLYISLIYDFMLHLISYRNKTFSLAQL